MDVTAENQLGRMVDRLVRDFADRVPEATVRTQVAQAVRELGEPKIVQFVPVLVDRSVRQHLRGLAAVTASAHSAG